MDFNINLSIFLCIYLSFYVFIHLSMYLSIFLCIYPSFNVFVPPFIYLSIHIIYLSIDISIYRYIYLTIYLSIYLYIYLSFYIYTIHYPFEFLRGFWTLANNFCWFDYLRQHLIKIIDYSENMCIPLSEAWPWGIRAYMPPKNMLWLNSKENVPAPDKKKLPWGNWGQIPKLVSL